MILKSWQDTPNTQTKQIQLHLRLLLPNIANTKMDISRQYKYSIMTIDLNYEEILKWKQWASIDAWTKPPHQKKNTHIALKMLPQDVHILTIENMLK